MDVITHLLNRRAKWWRDEPTGTEGRYTQQPVVLDDKLACRLSAPSPSDVTIGYRQQAVVSNVLYTDPGVAMLPGDWLNIEGETYRVLAEAPPSKPDHHLKWLLRSWQESAGVF